MRKLRFWAVALSALALAAPAAAQSSNKGEEFVEAVRKSDGNKVTELLAGNSNSGLVNSRSFDGETALTIALARSDEDWTGFLLNNGADPNLAAKSSDTPLIIAARVGFFDAVGWLLGLGAKVDVANRSGETALIVAVQARQPQVVRLLLNAGADPDRTDNVAGFSARDYAKRDPRARDVLKLIEAKKASPKG